jgi:hypothetical protein
LPAIDISLAWGNIPRIIKGRQKLVMAGLPFLFLARQKVFNLVAAGSPLPQPELIDSKMGHFWLSLWELRGRRTIDGNKPDTSQDLDGETDADLTSVNTADTQTSHPREMTFVSPPDPMAGSDCLNQDIRDKGQASQTSPTQSGFGRLLAPISAEPKVSDSPLPTRRPQNGGSGFKKPVADSSHTGFLQVTKPGDKTGTGHTPSNYKSGPLLPHRLQPNEANLPLPLAWPKIEGLGAERLAGGVDPEKHPDQQGEAGLSQAGPSLPHRLQPDEANLPLPLALPKIKVLGAERLGGGSDPKENLDQKGEAGISQAGPSAPSDSYHASTDALLIWPQAKPFVSTGLTSDKELGSPTTHQSLPSDLDGEVSVGMTVSRSGRKLPIITNRLGVAEHIIVRLVKQEVSAEVQRRQVALTRVQKQNRTAEPLEVHELVSDRVVRVLMKRMQALSQEDRFRSGLL